MGHPAIQAGRTAVITGGASGIGYAAAERFLASGMNVVIADRDQEALDLAASQLGENVFAVTVDVANLSDVEALRDTVVSRLGGIAVLMNNAGTGGGGGRRKARITHDCRSNTTPPVPSAYLHKS